MFECFQTMSSQVPIQSLGEEGPGKEEEKSVCHLIATPAEMNSIHLFQSVRDGHLICVCPTDGQSLTS